MKGEAARLNSSNSIKDTNYNIALTLLKDRYENKRSIIQAHLQAIRSQPVLKTESALGLRKLLELTNEHLRAPVELGQPVEHWNDILVFVLTEKMDPESRKQWQLDYPGIDVLSWELSKFRDTRSRALESGGTKVTSQSSVTSPCNQGNLTLTKRVQTYAVQGSSSESCQEVIAFTLVHNSKEYVLLIDISSLKTKNSFSTASNQDTRLMRAHLRSLAVSAKRNITPCFIDLRNSSLINAPLQRLIQV